MPNPLLTVAMSRTLRRLVLAVLAALLAVVVGAGLLVGMLVSVIFAGGASQSGEMLAMSSWLGCRVDASEVEEIEGLDREQVNNAAAIVNAAIELDLGEQAQILGIQAAWAASALRVPSDGARGLFALPGDWGTPEDRRDPVTASGLFFSALVAVDGWEELTPGEAIARAVEAPVAGYVSARAVAERVHGLFQAVCAVPADVASAAGRVLELEREGRVRFLRAAHRDQVVAAEAGTSSARCRLDVRTLQLIILAAREFEDVQVSSLNRMCTNELRASGYSSLHYRSPSLAVDFSMFDHQIATGADARSMQFVRLLAQVLPVGSGIGQLNCRQAAGRMVQTPGIAQFDDTCHHLHVQVPPHDAPLHLPGVESAETGSTPPRRADGEGL